eukprot:15466884-Alexandrium_andersonii.AAC.1
MEHSCKSLPQPRQSCQYCTRVKLMEARLSAGVPPMISLRKTMKGTEHGCSRVAARRLGKDAAPSRQARSRHGARLLRPA